MNFLFLSIFFCTFIANADPLSILQPIKQMSLLEKFKADPKAFVSEMSKADPQVLRQIISLLDGLLTTSEDREGVLVDNLNQKQTALDGANGRLVAAGVVLAQATAAQAAADAAVDAANDDLAARQAEQGVAQTERDDAQQQHDSEIDSLNDEQAVLRQVIEILKNLLDMQSTDLDPSKCEFDNGCDKCATVAWDKGLSELSPEACPNCDCGSKWGRQCGCIHCTNSPANKCIPIVLNDGEYCGTNRNELVCPDGVDKYDTGKCQYTDGTKLDYTVGGVPVGLKGWSDHGIYMHNNAAELYADDATWAEKVDITQRRCKELCISFDACVGLSFVENESNGLLRCDLHDICPWTSFTNDPNRAPEHWSGWKK